MRIGHGYDIHRLQAQKDAGFCLGGVWLCCDCIVVAHSDGDVLCHAIIDSLLGALALGDIGVHFPPQEARWRGAKSLDLLRGLYREKILANGYRLVNLDATVILQHLRLRPFIEPIRQELSGALSVLSELGHISVKAKTKEGLGAVGRGEAIEAYAVCLLERLPADGTVT